MLIGLNVNGEAVTVDVPPAARLLDVLRDRLGLTGAKDACGRGDCGACTVLVGNRALPSCLVLALRVDEPVRTVEGIAADARPLREAFADLGGLQCGYCTPGMVARGWQMLAETGPPDGTAAGAVSPSALRTALAGNFCRCTGYGGIVDALAAESARTGQAMAVAAGGSRAAEASAPTPETTVQPPLAPSAVQPERPRSSRSLNDAPPAAPR